MATIKTKPKTQKITSVVEDLEKMEPLCIVDGNAKWCRPYKKPVWWFLKTLKIELLYDATIQLLSIYPTELKAEPQRDICTLRPIAALFPVAKMWK